MPTDLRNKIFLCQKNTDAFKTSKPVKRNKQEL